MASIKETRLVQREVAAMKCDHCQAVALEEHVHGWLHLCVLDAGDVQVSMLSGKTEKRAVGRPMSERHLCPACAQPVLPLLGPLPAAPITNTIVQSKPEGVQ
jgi:hypothetical protein